MARFFTSDQHFGHANILKYEADYRKDHAGVTFRTVNHMNDAIVARWNATVTPHDTVYTLGDFSYKLHSIAEYLPRLNGRVVLIVGNHDPFFELCTTGRENEARELALSVGFADMHMQHVIEIDGYRRGQPDISAPGSQALPNPSITPGALNPAVTQQNLDETICRRGGYTKSIRPAESYTHDLKVKQIREYGYADVRLSDYSEDHLISLELGGSPDSPENLWPEPHNVVGGWGSYVKDKLENRLHDLVCKGVVTLADAQHEIANNWIGAYKALIGSVPNNAPSRY